MRTAAGGCVLPWFASGTVPVAGSTSVSGVRERFASSGRES